LDGRHRGAVKGQHTTSQKFLSYCPTVPECDLEKILAECGHASPRLRKLFADMAKDAQLAQNSHTCPPNKPSFVPRKTIKQMLKAGVIKLADPNTPINSIIFLVPEVAKSRSRIVIWPHWANEVSAYTWDHDYANSNDLVDIVHQCLDACFGATLDLRASFYQIPINDLSKLFVFMHGGVKYEFIRMPMGYSSAAEIMHLITNSLALKACEGEDCKHITHVDNVLFFAKNFDTLLRVLRKAEQIAAHWRITIGEISAAPSATVDFHGVTIDFQHKTVAMSQKAKEKKGSVRQLYYASSRLPPPTHHHLQHSWRRFPAVENHRMGTFLVALHVCRFEVLRRVDGQLVSRYAVV
jgi:hypothetical protein